MKKLFLAAGLLISTLAFSQSNESGTIQVGLGWGLTVGGATIESKDTSGTLKGDGVGAKVNYGLRAQYGFSDNLSAGIYVRGESAVYVVTYDDYTGTVPDVTYTGTAFGLEAKYYVVNHDRFNFYPALSVGFTTGSSEYDASYYSTTVESTSLSGLNYSVGVGLNWYFVKDVFGMSTDLAWQGTNLSGTQDATAYSAEKDITVNNGGLYWGFGFTAHFGGK
jgi:hypothetical protein